VFKPYASIGTNLLFFEKGTPTKDVWFYEHRVIDGQKAYSMTKPIRVEHLQGCVDWWGGAQRQDRQENDVAWKVDFGGLLADARARARPYWDEAEQAATQAATIKAKLSDVRSQIKELEKIRDGLDTGSKERQKLGDQLTAEKVRLDALTGDLVATEEKQRAAKRAGDAIYDAVFNLDFKNPAPLPTTTAIRPNCWPNWNKTNSKPPPCATSSTPFWRRRCCDEGRTPAATLRSPHRSPRRHPAPAAVHPRSCRARQTGGTRPQRRTGGGTAQAD